MMVPIWVLAVGGAAILLLLFPLLRRRRDSRDLTAPPSRLRAAVPSVTLPPGMEEQARALIAENHHIDAIKLVREATGLGLMEAKTMIDAIERGDPV